MNTEGLFIEFSRRKRRKAIASTVTIGLLFVIITLIPRTWGKSLSVGFAVLVMGAFGAFVWKDWRCPACHRALGRDFHYTCCPHCGRRLTA